MAYNVKITEYANGQLEVTTYKQGVYTIPARNGATQEAII